MMYWYGSHLAFWQVALMWLGTVAFWVLVAWAVFALVRTASGGSSLWAGDARPPQNAQRILDERLAKGEIDVEEYRRLRHALNASDRHREPVSGTR